MCIRLRARCGSLSFGRAQPGTNAARFLSHPAHLPPHVHLPSIVNDGDGLPVPGQDSGFLGERHASFKVLGDPRVTTFSVPALGLAEGMSRERLGRRLSLTDAVARGAGHIAAEPAGRGVDASYARAANLLSPATASAFDLSAESPKERDRYGRHHFGQSLLFARRLVEAGVPFVTVYWNAPSQLRQSKLGHPHQPACPYARAPVAAFRPGLSAFSTTCGSGACSTKPWSPGTASSVAHRRSTATVAATIGGSVNRSA